VTLLDTYRQLGAAVCVDEERAQRIVNEAMPHAQKAVGALESLPVRTACVPAKMARGGSLIPAWPIRQPDGSVVIEYVADWGALLAGWLDVADDPLARSLVLRGDRVWIGVANDVVQMFVPDPPTEDYSMVRHHALMLAAATTWRGSDAVAAWRIAHASAARRFLKRHATEPLWDAVGCAEAALADLLRDERTRGTAVECLAWLGADAAAAQRYRDFLGAASLGVAAILDVLQEGSVEQWMATEHQRPEFNRVWMEAFACRS
jgi:hypothetical protein